MKNSSPRASVRLALLLSFASILFAGEQETFQIRLGADWRAYGVNSSKTGFGPFLGASRILLDRNRTQFAAGGEIAWYPNQREYVYENNSGQYGRVRENHILYAGIPLTLRHHFSDGRVAPFAEIQNRLDLRVLQRTEHTVFPTKCSGYPVQTCVENDDYHEDAKNNLLVWRQTLAAGLRIRVQKTSILWSEGIQWEVTPGREATRFGPPARGIFLSSSLGFSF